MQPAHALPRPLGDAPLERYLARMFSLTAALALLTSAPCRAADGVTVDATRTVVLSNAELVAMGGAGMAFATGANGLFFHPAAPAHRRVEQSRRAAVTFSFLQLNVGAGSPDDIPNVGTEDWSGRQTNLGLSAVFDGFGAGFAGGQLSYADGDLRVDIDEAHLALAAVLPDRSITFGLGLRAQGGSVYPPGQPTERLSGAGLEGGAIGAFPDSGFNFAIVARTPVIATPQGDDAGPVARWHVPWQLGAGLAWASRAEPSAADGPPLRVALDLILDGPVPDAYAVEPLLQGDAVRKGLGVTLSPHVGVELEPWRDHGRLRLGSYLEPARALTATSRPHGTAGLELKLFRVRLFRGLIDDAITWEAAVDAAPRYVNLAWLGIGTWRLGVVGGDRSLPLEPTPGLQR